LKPFLFLIAIIFIPSFTFAEITINAGLQSEGQYNDNIFLDRSENDGKESDYIFRIGPQFDVDYKTRYLDATLTCSYETRRYIRNSEENDDVLDFDFDFDFGGTQLGPIGDLLYLDIGTRQQRTPVDSRGPTAFNNLLNNRTEQRGFTISPYLGQQLTSTIAVLGGYSFSTVDFTSIGTNGSLGEGEDYKDHNVFASISKMTGKTTIDLNYNHLKHQATLNESYNRDDLSLGVQYLASRKLTFDGEIGRHWFDSKRDSISNDNFGHITASYLLSRNKTFEIGYSVKASGASGFENIAPSPEEPLGPVAEEIEPFVETRSGASRTRRMDMTFTRRGKVNSTVNAYASNINFLEQGREDILRGITVRFARQLSGRTTIFLRLQAEKRKFIGGFLDDETSYIYYLEPSLSYRLTSRFTARIAYNYNTQHSNREESEFANNVAWISIGLALPDLQKLLP